MPELDPSAAIRTPSGATPVAGGLPGDAPPFRVSDHTLIRRVGRGAYGEVWLARNALGTWRAVKFVRRSSFDDDKPFEREFAGIQRFEPISRSHESQLNILHVGRAGDGFYYVMELADDMGRGQEIDEATYTPRNLRSELHLRGRLPAAECLRLGLALTTALEHLHKHGLVHRDIKPSNIVFVNGIPKLADIGLVARAEATASFVGTEGFIPPEGPGTREADIYSLGKVLYEISTGHDRNQFPELPTNIIALPDRAELSELNEVLLKACHRDPKQRYQTAAEMHADLALLESGRSVLRLRGIERRLQVAQRVGVVFLVLAALIASGWWWQARQTRLVRQLAEEKERARQQAQENLYVADIRAAYHDWENGQITRMLEALKRHVPQPSEQDLRGWEWYYLLALCHRDERTLSGHTGVVRSVSCDPTGRRFASGSADHTVRIWEATSGKLIAELKGHQDSVACVAWSPDGHRFASGANDGKLIIWSAETFGKIIELDCERDVFSLAWSPDGKCIAVGGNVNVRANSEKLVTVWDATSGQHLQHLRGSEDVQQIWALAWQPGGKVLLGGGDFRGMMQAWNTDTGQTIRTFKAHSHHLSAISWSPDGRRFATASADQRVTVWDATTWQAVTIIDPAHNGEPRSLTWSADGQRLVSAGKDGLVKIWNPNTGKLLNTLRGHQGPVYSLAAWHREARILSGSADGTVKIWNGESGQAARTLGDGIALVWSPDGQQIATDTRRRSDLESGGTPGPIEIVDVATWKTILALPSETGTLTYPFAWSPDGRRLAARVPASDLVRIWDLTSNTEFLTLEKEHGGEGAEALAWSPDGRWLATGNDDQAVHLWNVETKQNIRTLRGHSGYVGSVVWNPDGRRLASKDWSGNVVIWDASSGEMVLKLRSPGGGTAGRQCVLTWNPAGSELAAGNPDGSIIIWQTSDGRELQLLKGHTSTVRAVHWSPDGRRLVSGAEDRTIRIWDIQNGRELLVLPDLLNRIPKVAWSPDGRMIGVVDDSTLIFDATIGYELAPTLTPAGTNR